MWQEKINFTMTAAPREGGARIFNNSIGRILRDGVGGGSFTAVEIAGSTAVLRGEIVGDRRLVTEQAIAEYLEDTLAAKEAIHLDLDIRLETESLPLPGERPAAMAA